MLLSDSLAAAIAIPAALILIAIFVRSAIKMSAEEAGALHSTLAAAIAAIMFAFASDYFFNTSNIPVLGYVIELIGGGGGFVVLYLAIVATTFLFRPRFRVLGVQLLVLSAMTIWWAVLAEPSRVG